MINSNNTLMIQKIVRKNISNKNNIYYCLKSKDIIKEFVDNIKGFHLLNKTPIKEAVWEDLNVDIVKHKCSVTDFANGNHKSGKDNRFNNWNISNKTCKIDDNDKINISSYRLTRVCNHNNFGEKDNIIKEIDKRDSSFDYYSILGRKEFYSNNNLDYIKYYWFIIPKDYYVFNIKKNNMKLKKGKITRNKGKTVGWEGTYFDITFSMSSQLWFHFHLDDIKKFIIATVDVQINKSVLTYSEIYNLRNKTIIYKDDIIV